ILSSKWADEVMKKINAKVVIPYHYHVNGVNIPGWAGSEPAVQWVNTHEHTMLDSATVVVTKEKIKDLKQQAWYFGDHVACPLPGPAATDPQVTEGPDPTEAWKQLVQQWPRSAAAARVVATGARVRQPRVWPNALRLPRRRHIQGRSIITRRKNQDAQLTR